MNDFTTIDRLNPKTKKESKKPVKLESREELDYLLDNNRWWNMYEKTAGEKNRSAMWDLYCYISRNREIIDAEVARLRRLDRESRASKLGKKAKDIHYFPMGLTVWVRQQLFRFLKQMSGNSMQTLSRAASHMPYTVVIYLQYGRCKTERKGEQKTTSSKPAEEPKKHRNAERGARKSAAQATDGKIVMEVSESLLMRINAVASVEDAVATGDPQAILSTLRSLPPEMQGTIVFKSA